MADLETDDLRQLSKQPQGEGADQVDLSDETQDFRFLGMFAGIGNSGGGKKGAAADPTIPKRGEKDFAPDGTDLQSRVLAESREAMHNALSGVRTHTSKVNVHCTWRPSRGKAEVKVAKGTHFKAMGVADKEGVLWLEREEVVYLVERGGVECWWEEGIPMSLQGVYAECLGNVGAGAIERYQVYAYLKRSGYIVQRAETFPTFDAPPLTPSPPSILKTPLNFISYHPPHRLPPTGFFLSLFRPILHPTPSSTGPLIPYQTTLRSQAQIYSRLSLIPCHHPSLSPPTPTSPENTPFKITYNVWKPQPHFKKTDPGAPDFRICVISTTEHEGILTLGEISGLLESVPLEYPPLPRIAKEEVKEADGSKKKQQVKDKATTKATATTTATATTATATTTSSAINGSGGEKKKTTSTWESKSIYQRLKDGRRGAILAVVDMGVISFIRVGDVGFGEEKLWEGSGPRRKGRQMGSGQVKGKGKAPGKNTAGGGASTT